MGSKPIVSRQAILIADLHHPEHDEKVFAAELSYIRRNNKRISHVVLMGDNMNCEEISRHTKGKPRLRTPGSFKRNLDAFDRDVLQPIEAAVLPGTKLVFLFGNHEDWLEQWLDENPEFEGVMSFDRLLSLTKRGWTTVPQGGQYWIGKACIIHGDQVGSGMYIAKKVVDAYCCTVIMGHVHTLSLFTKVSDIKRQDKWIGATIPTSGTVAPRYAKGRPNAFLNGFGILEQMPNEFVNLYVPIVFEGRFPYGGEIYDYRDR